jgi:NNP family nitrate/nitrite transporter-like MFS transporter
LGPSGGFFVQQFFGASIRATGMPTSAFALLVAFYATCLAITWWHYLRVTAALGAPAAEIEVPDGQRTP